VWRHKDAYDYRVEQFTPLGQVVLRRLDSEHEFIWRVSTLVEECTPCTPLPKDVLLRDLDRILDEGLRKLDRILDEDSV
jgi:hypothetical protein